MIIAGFRQAGKEVKLMSTIIVGAVVFGLIGLAAYSTFRGKKKGGCGCGCSGCAMEESCHKEAGE